MRRLLPAASTMIATIPMFWLEAPTPETGPRESFPGFSFAPECGKDRFLGFTGCNRFTLMQDSAGGTRPESNRPGADFVSRSRDRAPIFCSYFLLPAAEGTPLL